MSQSEAHPGGIRVLITPGSSRTSWNTDRLLVRVKTAENTRARLSARPMRPAERCRGPAIASRYDIHGVNARCTLCSLLPLPGAMSCTAGRSRFSTARISLIMSAMSSSDWVVCKSKAVRSTSN